VYCDVRYVLKAWKHICPPEDDIYEEIKKRVEESEDFSTVEEYVNFVLEEILKDEEEEEVAYSEE